LAPVGPVEPCAPLSPVPPLGDAPALTDDEVTAGKYYAWDETAYQADNTTGWELITPE